MLVYYNLHHESSGSLRIWFDFHVWASTATQNSDLSFICSSIQAKSMKSACGPSVLQRIAEDQEVKLIVFCTRPSVRKRYWIYCFWAEFSLTFLLTYGAFSISGRSVAVTPGMPKSPEAGLYKEGRPRASSHWHTCFRVSSWSLALTRWTLPPSRLAFTNPEMHWVLIVLVSNSVKHQLDVPRWKIQKECHLKYPYSHIFGNVADNQGQ